MAVDICEFLEDSTRLDLGEIFIITTKDTPESIIRFLLEEKEHWRLDEALKVTKAELIDIINNIVVL